MTFCDCNNGLYKDRYLSDGKLGCPACDPELGNFPEQRKENYKTLISTPIPDTIKDFFK